MTRIIGGSAGGRRIQTPRGVSTRPTSDRVREALFSAIESWCGSLQRAPLPRPVRRVRRGRASRRGRGVPGVVTLVEQDRRTAQLIAANARDARLRQGQRRHRRRCPALSSGPPPRRTTWRSSTRRTRSRTRRSAATCRAWSTTDWLVPGALVVVERSSRSPEPGWPDGFTDVRDRRYGETMLWYGHAASRPRPGQRRAVRQPRSSPCAEPSVPGRSTRSPTGTSTSSPAPRPCSTRSWSRSASTSPRAGCSPPRSGSTCCARRAAGFDNVRVDGFTGLLTDFCQRAGHPRHRQGPARGQRLRLRAADGPDERLPGRGGDRVRAHQPGVLLPRVEPGQGGRDVRRRRLRAWCRTSCTSDSWPALAERAAADDD